MKNLLKTAAALALAAVCSGCMWGRVRVNDPSIVDRAAGIRIGKTKVSELGQILRADPSLRMPIQDGTILGYTYADSKANGLILILFNFTKSQTVAQTLYVIVDPKTETVKKVYVPERKEIEWEYWPFGDD